VSVSLKLELMWKRSLPRAMYRDRINVKGLFFGAAIIEALKSLSLRDSIPLFFENTLFYVLSR
ncbi:MAG: hypothetical protein ACXAEL_09335, partial [Candidatus Hodarchaeales archaeon]